MLPKAWLLFFKVNPKIAKKFSNAANLTSAKIPDGLKTIPELVEFFQVSPFALQKH